MDSSLLPLPSSTLTLLAGRDCCPILRIKRQKVMWKVSAESHSGVKLTALMGLHYIHFALENAFYDSYIFGMLCKGQLISKCPFGVFKSTKKQEIF